MSELEEAVGNIEEWLADNASVSHRKAFYRDVTLIITVARESIELKKHTAADVLLSDEFLKKFAAAFAATPMPSTITNWGQK